MPNDMTVRAAATPNAMANFARKELPLPETILYDTKSLTCQKLYTKMF